MRDSPLKNRARLWPWLAAGAVWLALAINLAALQQANLDRAEAAEAAGDSFNALFHYGQCLRQANWLANRDQQCQSRAAYLLRQHPALSGYLEAASRARERTAAGWSEILLHLGFVGFLATLVAGAVRQQKAVRPTAKGLNPWWTVTAVAFLGLWLLCAYLA